MLVEKPLKEGNGNNSNANYVKVGNVSFLRNVDLRILVTCLEYFKNAQFQVAFQQSFQQRWKHIFSMMRKCDQECFVFMNTTKQFKVVQRINQIQFVNMKKLTLYNCNIYNIEGLAQTQMQNLTQLHLSHNFIRCVKSLKKISSLNLSEIALDYNPIKEFIHLSRIKLQNSDKKNSIKLEFLSLRGSLSLATRHYVNKNDEVIAIVEDLSQFISVQNLQNFNLKHTQRNRISQTKLSNFLRQQN